MPIGKVLCLGGSLTAGNDTSSTSFRTYRGTLQNLLATAGLTLDFIGPQTLAAAAGGNDPNHAGWVDASIDATGSASNNLTSRLAALKTDYPSPDLIVIDPPWWDIINAPGSLASRYSTFIGAVQSGAWASVKILMCTAHPASGSTAVQTGTTYAAYPLVNAQMETLRAAAASTRYVARLDALTSAATSATLTEQALYYAQSAPQFSTLEGGGSVPAWQGGHLVTSFASITSFNAQWSTNPPAVGNAPGGMGLSDANVSSWNGSVNRFVQSVSGVTPWYWVWSLPGNAAVNTCIEVRNGFAAGKRIGGGWEFFYSGARLGERGSDWNGSSYQEGYADSRSRWGQRSDGLTTWHAPRGNHGIEVWPRDTIPSRGIVEFFGGFNRDLLVNSECFWFGVQARLALIDPNGVDDRSQARFGNACGADYFAQAGGRHYDRYGWPYNAMDGGHDAWTRFTATDWTMVSSITIGREGTPDTGVHADYHWSDPGTPPPLANWAPPTEYNNPSAGRARTATQIRANPLPIPPYWEGGTSTGGSGSGYLVNDYVSISGTRIYLLLQSGADKVAGVMSAAIIASAALSTFTGGGITFQPMQGLALRPNVWTKLAGSNKNVEPKDWGIVGAPIWQTTLPEVTFATGATVTGSRTAIGNPAPTYSKVSGPSWISINASTGALTGTAPGTAETSVLVLRATNSAGTAPDLSVNVVVTPALSVIDTPFPTLVVGVAAVLELQAAGALPITWSAPAINLPPGMTLSAAGVLSGTPTTAVSGSVLVTATNPGGSTTRTFSWQVFATSPVPVITATALAAGTVGVVYVAEVSATGAAPITYSAAGLPAGLALVAGTTNRIRNPSGAGAVVGTPGTMPVNWATIEQTGVARTVVGFGTEAGLPYVDIRFAGTPSGGGVIAAYFETGTGVAAANGQTFCLSFYQRLVGGYATGISSSILVFDENTSGGAYIRNTVVAVAMPTAAALATQRVSGVATMSGGVTVGAIRPVWFANVTNAVAIDITIRFAGVQLEQAAAATFYADPRYAYIAGTPTAPGLYIVGLTAANGFDLAVASLPLRIGQPASAVEVVSPWSKFLRR